MAGPASVRAARSSPIGPCAAATIMPPPARCAAHQIGQAVLRRHIERRGRLVEQPDRPRHREQPRDRQPPPLPGRQIGRRQIGQRREVDRLQRGVDRQLDAAEKARPELQVFGDRQRRLQRVLMAEIMRLLGDRGLRLAAVELELAAGQMRTSPAIRRSSEDLPAPLRPVTTSASPPGQAEIEARKDLAPAADAASDCRP